MKSLQSFLLIFLSFLSFSFLLVVQASASHFGDLETKIFSGSNTKKIKKMQLALKEFQLYEGVIDGNYNTVKLDLIKYQKNTGIYKNLGYFGIKTLKALKEDFPNEFTRITQKYLKMDKPSTNIRYFYLTAYYSPIKGQKRYTTGSYYGDIRLNGGGKKTASGKGVFTGILAGPRNYAFGTKVEFEGLGVGIVEDRGGAIVNSGERGFEFDRIDVWMGYGDEGLERALKWGKRKVKGKVVPNTRQISIAFGESSIYKYKNLKIDAEAPKKKNVLKLQKLFTEIKKYKGPINGNFNLIKKDLIEYQVSKSIIKSKNDNNAGYFGKKTYLALRKDYSGEIIKLKNNELDKDVNLSIKVKKKLNKVNNTISKIIEKKYGNNKLLGMRYRQRLRVAIDKQTKKIKNKKRKIHLMYIKSII